MVSPDIILSIGESTQSIRQACYELDQRSLDVVDRCLHIVEVANLEVGINKTNPDEYRSEIPPLNIDPSMDGTMLFKKFQISLF